MRRILCCVLLLALFLTACGEADFNGSRTGNDGELTMEFKVMNTTDTQDLTVEEGESIHAEISVDKGSLSVTIQKGDEAPIYEDCDLQEDIVFDAALEEAGTYTVSVTGRRARGSVSFTVEPAA